MCACVRVCVRACVRACVCERSSVLLCLLLRALHGEWSSPNGVGVM